MIKRANLAAHFTPAELDQLVRAARTAVFFDHTELSPQQQDLVQRVDDMAHAERARKLPEPPVTGEAILIAAMRTAIADTGEVSVDLHPDGFDIVGPDDVLLHRSTGSYEPADLAKFLGIPTGHVHDAR